MTEAPVPPLQPIAAVLADVDGTLVTRAKAVTERAIDAVEKLHERGVLFAITSGRPPRGMRMLVHPLEIRGPMAAFNGGIIVQPDMTILDERTVPADLAPAVIDAIRAHGLYPWIYRGAEWYVTDPDAPHAAHEASTVQFQPTVVPHYYKIPREQIATLGDGANDVLMFERSGLSIAMGNATEEVQRQATCVTASNEDDGFAKAVEQFILPRAVAAP
jgi:hydroxymethylpyrimidine pyrophosphatase-like HAD family hydrolase